jgi:hypothetical protein
MGPGAAIAPKKSRTWGAAANCDSSVRIEHALLATVTSRRFLTTIASRRVGIMLSYFWQGIFNAESADAT